MKAISSGSINAAIVLINAGADVTKETIHEKRTASDLAAVTS